MGSEHRRGRRSADASPELAELAAQVRDLQVEAANRRVDSEHFGRFEADVIRDLGRLSTMAAHLEHLRARPYVSDESALSVRDGRGRAAMGYVDVGAGAAGRASRYSDFEELFRGSRKEIQRRQQVYVDMVRGVDGPVVDLGCGTRGAPRAAARLGPARLGGRP